MPGDKRPPAKRLADRAAIASMRARCYTRAQIAAELGLSLATIKREWKLITAEWQAAMLEDADQVKARELAKLDALEEEALRAWEKSKQDYQKRIVEEKPGSSKHTGGRYAKVETGKSNGDPRFLQVLLSIQERRARLLGTDKPIKVASTDPTGEHESKAYAFPVPPQLSPEEWQAWVHTLKPSTS